MNDSGVTTPLDKVGWLWWGLACSIPLVILLFVRADEYGMVWGVSCAWWIAITVLFLIHAYRLLQVLEIRSTSVKARYLGLHLIAHAVPIVYLGFGGESLFKEVSQVWLDLAWVIVLLPFFYSGRLIWSELSRNFGVFPYGLFFRGNTSVLFMLPALYAAGLILNNTGLVHHLLFVYFVVHFALVGFTVVRLRRDIQNLVTCA
ncbi:hypothetical protein [Ectothiorhodospira variabilis]|uniref:hypothetical protein n=1 Tax=Ectothiorhodospira variabilis TaxID=505694 RepID=UPI001EFAC490|nr:hypothetical protein [Ectothiorhodospira variabilis]MCG5497641.1 hypothetical protein [Ectothiorhodospira variabilis]